jgi:hypothetical protein
MALTYQARMAEALYTRAIRAADESAGAVDPRRLDARTVLVVDEAGMVGSRKLTRLLEHAQQVEAKVVLVGDDRQLAAINAGVASAPSGCDWVPRSWSRTAASTRPGNARPWNSCARGWWRRRWPPTGPMTGWWPSTASRPPPWPCCGTGGRPGSRLTATRPKLNASGVGFPIPWASIAVLVAAAAVASVLATVWPAHQASKIRPAVALRIAD